MYRNRRRILSAAFFFLFALLLCGCGSKKWTADALIRKTAENVDAQKSFDANMLMKIGMRLAQDGLSMNLDMTADFDVQSTTEPEALHMKGTMDFDIEEYKIAMELYTVKEEDSFVSYVGAEDVWRRQITGGVDDLAGGGATFAADGVKYTLEDKPEEADGRTLYVLHSQITGTDLEKVLGDMSGVLESVTGEVGGEDTLAEVTLKIDAETILPVSMEIEISGNLENEETESTSDEEVSGMTVTLTYRSFGDIPEIIVPSEVKEAARRAEEEDFSGIMAEDTEKIHPEDPVNEDGSYTIKSNTSDHSVRIRVPEGYKVTPISETGYLFFSYETNNKHSEKVDLFYHLEEIPEDYPDTLYQSLKERIEENTENSEIEISEIKEAETASGKIRFFSSSYVYDEEGYYKEYYCFLPISEGVALELDLMDYSYSAPGVEIKDEKLADFFADVK